MNWCSVHAFQTVPDRLLSRIASFRTIERMGKIFSMTVAFFQIYIPLNPGVFFSTNTNVN